MKCSRCRAEILSNNIKTCPYCGSLLAAPSPGTNKKVERTINHETKEVAEKIKEAIEAQKAFYKSEEKSVTKKLEKGSKKKYSTSDIIVLIVSLALTFIVLAITLSLILKR